MEFSMDDQEAQIFIQHALTYIRECNRTLPGISDHLANTVTNREKDFLALGERLGNYSGRARELSNKAADIAKQTGGKAVTGITRELLAKLEEMNAICGLDKSRKDLDDYREIENSIVLLTKQINEFKRIVRYLEILGISTRIESARIGEAGAGFTTLASDVKGLAAYIVDSSSEIVDKTEELLKQIVAAKSQTQDMYEIQRECSENVFRVIRDDVDKLTQMTESGRELLQTVEEEARHTAKNIGEAVSSMQFHDITRQQLEHVEQSLRDILSIVNENGDSGIHMDKRDQYSEVVGWIKDVGRLQLSQTRNAKERFTEAVDKLKESLLQISENVASMSRHVQGVTAGKDTMGGSLLLDIEQSIDHVIQAMIDFARQGEGIGGIMAKVADTVGDMAEFVNNIEQVGNEIELIAINAAVKAAHTGKEGKALGVLAESIQSLSRETGEKTEAVSKVLQSITSLSGTMRQSAASYMDKSQVEQMTESFRKMMDDLKALNTSMTEAFPEIDVESQSLSKEIRATTEKVNFHELVAQELDGFIEELQNSTDKAMAIVPHEGEGHRPEKLRELLERYTMEMERLVHESLFNPSFTADGEESVNEMQSSDGESDGEDDWDNVELF